MANHPYYCALRTEDSPNDCHSEGRGPDDRLWFQGTSLGCFWSHRNRHSPDSLQVRGHHTAVPASMQGDQFRGPDDLNSRWPGPIFCVGRAKCSYFLPFGRTSPDCFAPAVDFLGLRRSGSDFRDGEAGHDGPSQGDEASRGEAGPRQPGGRRRAAQGDAASLAKEKDAASLSGRVVQSVGDAPLSGRRPGETERRFSRRSGMVCRRPWRTTGKRQDQSCGGRAP